MKAANLIKATLSRQIDRWSSECLHQAVAFKLEYNNQDSVDYAFFNTLYWNGPANTSLRNVDSFNRRFTALLASTTIEKHLSFLKALQPAVENIVLTVKAMADAAIADPATLVLPQTPKAALARAQAANLHNHRLVKVVRTEVARGYKFVGTFQDGTTVVLRPCANRPYTLATVRANCANLNIRDGSARSFVSLHSVRPTDDARNPILQSIAIEIA